MKIILFTLALILLRTYSLTNNQILNQVFYGIFQQNQLPQPQYCIECFDDVTAKKIIGFLNVTIPQLAKLLPPVEKIKNDVMGLINQLQQSLIWCLGYNYQIQFLGQKLGIQAGSSPYDIARQFEIYYVLHEQKTHKFFKQLDKLWQANDFKKAGFEFSVFIHVVIDGKN